MCVQQSGDQNARDKHPQEKHRQQSRTKHSAPTETKPNQPINIPMATQTKFRSDPTQPNPAQRTSCSSCSLDARSLVTRPGAVKTKPSPAFEALCTDHPDPTVIARLGSLSPFFLNWLSVVPCWVENVCRGGGGGEGQRVNGDGRVLGSLK